MSNDNVQTQAFDGMTLETVGVVLRGPQGEPGPRGIKGDTGANNYQLWIANGNVGTYDDYLASLKGQDGLNGKVVNRGYWQPGVYNPGDFVIWVNTDGDYGLYFVLGGESFVSSNSPDIDTEDWSFVPVDNPDLSNVVTVLADTGIITMDCSQGQYFTLMPVDNITGFIFENLPGVNRAVTLRVQITQGTTPRTVTWPASFKWAGGVAGSVTATANAVDVLTISTYDQGATWNANLSKGFS